MIDLTEATLDELVAEIKSRCTSTLFVLGMDTKLKSTDSIYTVSFDGGWLNAIGAAHYAAAYLLKEQGY